MIDVAFDNVKDLPIVYDTLIKADSGKLAEEIVDDIVGQVILNKELICSFVDSFFFRQDNTLYIIFSEEALPSLESALEIVLKNPFVARASMFFLEKNDRRFPSMQVVMNFMTSQELELTKDAAHRITDKKSKATELPELPNSAEQVKDTSLQIAVKNAKMLAEVQ